MMVGFEQILVFLIVAGAVLALARRFWLFVSQTGQSGSSCGSSCGGCSSNSDEAAPSVKPLVQLELNSREHAR